MPIGPLLATKCTKSHLYPFGGRCIANTKIKKNVTFLVKNHLFLDILCHNFLFYVGPKTSFGVSIALVSAANCAKFGPNPFCAAWFFLMKYNFFAFSVVARVWPEKIQKKFIAKNSSLSLLYDLLISTCCVKRL